jgi:ABC-type polysaccharide/polyol phosphate export permease
MVLARKDFQVRYKRAVLGVLWAVVQPLLQAVVLVAVFSRVLKNVSDASYSYGGFVLAGVLAWSYLTSTLGVASTSIVDGSGLSDKVWFPRAILAIVPGIANLVGLGSSIVILVALMPILDARYTTDLLLLGPAVVLLVAFVTALSLCLSALHVYFRDVRYLVGATLLLWFYVTPVIYPGTLLGGAGRWLDLNPMTGIVGLFQRAVVGPVGPIAGPVAVSCAVTCVLLVIGAVAHRRYDRLFVDLL